MWVDENYKVGNDLAHGNEPVNVEKVASVVDKLDITQRVAYRFLQDWRDKLLCGDWELSSEKLPDSDEDVPIY
jgi:hypothetical protein